MKLLSTPKLVLALAGAAGSAWIAHPTRPATEVAAALYRQSARIYQAELGLLKMDWSGPQVFCTELSISYDPATRTCGKRGPLTHRAFGAADARP